LVLGLFVSLLLKEDKGLKRFVSQASYAVLDSPWVPRMLAQVPWTDGMTPFFVRRGRGLRKSGHGALPAAIELASQNE